MKVLSSYELREDKAEYEQTEGILKTNDEITFELTDGQCYNAGKDPLADIKLIFPEVDDT